MSQEAKIEKTLAPHTGKSKHAIVHSGLNLKGRCQNPNCRGKTRIWVKLGYGTFDISK
jgi:hypothetical protein